MYAFPAVKPVIVSGLVVPVFEKDGYDILEFCNGLEYELNYESVIVPSKFKVLPLQITSEFPYGYSLDMGRRNLYYTEYVCNHLLSHIEKYLNKRKFNYKVSVKDMINVVSST